MFYKYSIVDKIKREMEGEMIKLISSGVVFISDAVTLSECLVRRCSGVEYGPVSSILERTIC